MWWVKCRRCSFLGICKVKEEDILVAISICIFPKRRDTLLHIPLSTI